METKSKDALKDIAAKSLGFSDWNALKAAPNPNEGVVYVATEIKGNDWTSSPLPIGTYSTPYLAKAACWLHLQSHSWALGRASLKFTDYSHEIEGDTKYTHYHIEFVELDERFKREEDIYSES